MTITNSEISLSSESLAIAILEPTMETAWFFITTAKMVRKSLLWKSSQMAWELSVWQMVWMMYFDITRECSCCCSNDAHTMF